MSSSAAHALPLVESLPKRLRTVMVDITMALLFLVVWIAPRPSGVLSFGEAMLLLMVEGIVVLGGIFVGVMVIDHEKRASLPLPVRLGMVAFVGVAFVAFGIFFGLAAGVWSPAVAMAVLFYDKFGAAGRLLRMSGSERSDESRRLAIQWGLRLPLLLIALSIAGLLPWPALGLSGDPAAADGTFGTRPQIFIVGGTLYFAAAAAVKFFASGRLTRHVNR